MTIRVALLRSAMTPDGDSPDTSPASVLVVDDKSGDMSRIWADVPRKALVSGQAKLAWSNTPWADDLTKAHEEDTDGDHLAALMLTGLSNSMDQIVSTQDFDDIEAAADYVYGEVWNGPEADQ